MNVDTGELRHFQDIPPELQKDFQEVPTELANEAMMELNGEDRAFVDMTKNTPLVRWAKKQRKNKKKSRSKMAKKSRQRNRK